MDTSSFIAGLSFIGINALLIGTGWRLSKHRRTLYIVCFVVGTVTFVVPMLIVSNALIVMSNFYNLNQAHYALPTGIIVGLITAPCTAWDRSYLVEKSKCRLADNFGSVTTETQRHREQP